MGKVEGGAHPRCAGGGFKPVPLARRLGLSWENEGVDRGFTTALGEILITELSYFIF